MINRFLTKLGIICIVIAVGAVIGICIGQTATSRYLTCQYWSYEKGAFKTVNCRSNDPQLRGGEDTPAPTVTGYYWTPEASDTAEPTQEATATPEATWTAEPPYPLPLDPVYWYSR